MVQRDETFNQQKEDEKNQHLTGAGIFVIGFLLVGATASWWAAIGVTLMLWGNNLTTVYKKIMKYTRGYE